MNGGWEIALFPLVKITVATRKLGVAQVTRCCDSIFKCRAYGEPKGITNGIQQYSPHKNGFQSEENTI